MDSRRPLLAMMGQPITAHAGLWYDKYLIAQPDRGEPLTQYQELVQSFENFSEPAIYKQFYKRWEQAFTDVGVTLYLARTRGRQVIGLGSAGVIENAITLHHTYGVPYLPGSALKGLAAHYAHNYLDKAWRKDQEAHNRLFGTQKQAGIVTFHDALPSQYRFEPDILTVHHRDYYQKGETPADWDNPVPIPFLTIFSGVFHIPLAGPKAWVEAAATILYGALSEMGIGAKTHSGYGRMRLEGVGEPEEPLQPIVLEQGSVILVRVKQIGKENIYLELDPDRFTNVDENAEQLVFLQKSNEYAFEAGDELWCYVLGCDIEDVSAFVECRLATDAEQPQGHKKKRK